MVKDGDYLRIEIGRPISKWTDPEKNEYAYNGYFRGNRFVVNSRYPLDCKTTYGHVKRLSEDGKIISVRGYTESEIKEMEQREQEREEFMYSRAHNSRIDFTSIEGLQDEPDRIIEVAPTIGYWGPMSKEGIGGYVADGRFRIDDHYADFIEFGKPVPCRFDRVHTNSSYFETVIFLKPTEEYLRSRPNLAERIDMYSEKMKRFEEEASALQKRLEFDKISALFERFMDDDHGMSEIISDGKKIFDRAYGNIYESIKERISFETYGRIEREVVKNYFRYNRHPEFSMGQSEKTARGLLGLFDKDIIKILNSAIGESQALEEYHEQVRKIFENTKKKEVKSERDIFQKFALILADADLEWFRYVRSEVFSEYKEHGTDLDLTARAGDHFLEHSLEWLIDTRTEDLADNTGN